MAAAPGRGRRRSPEEEEIAVAVPGAFPERQQRGEPNQWAQWRGGNGNKSGPVKQTRYTRDSAIMLKLIQSSKVHRRELCSYRTPVAILGQGPRIDPTNAAIQDIVNNMAFSRRIVLDYKLKRKANAAEAKELERKLKLWPSEVRQLQGHVEAEGGRYLRIPDVLLDPVKLLE